MTVNELLVLMKMVRERMKDLKDLRSELAVRERFFGSTEKEKIPQYDVKLVDAKITMLQNFIFKADAKIKMSNAKTKVDIDVNVDELLAPME